MKIEKNVLKEGVNVFEENKAQIEGRDRAISEKTLAPSYKKIGILALQGDYEAHVKIIASLACDFCYVRTVLDLQKCGSLIIPGGESTTLLWLMHETGLFDAIKNFNRPIFGTCAGTIVLAKSVVGLEQKTLGLIDIAVMRNAFGRQISSRIEHGVNYLTNEEYEMIFIRAPKIVSYGPSVKVLATCSNDPVCVREGNIMVATFHPELSHDSTLHRYFCSIIN